MKKEEKFRIIELLTHQVLLTKAFDNENDEAEYVLRITIFFDGIEANLALNYSNEETRDKLFNEMKDEQAQAFLNNVQSQFEGQ